MSKLLVIEECKDCPLCTATGCCSLTRTKRNITIPDACPLPNGNPEDDFSCYMCHMNHISQGGIKEILLQHLDSELEEDIKNRQYLQDIYHEIFGD